MSAPKFTPGPWGYRISESGAIAIFNAEGTWVATTLRKQWPKEDRANANLIATAPELYEALECLVRAGIGNSTDYVLQAAGMQMARAALTKAT